MSPYRRNVLVGATVLLALGILGWMILQFGGNVITPFTAAKVRVYFVGDRSDGISDGSAIVYRGVVVGQVGGVKLEQDVQRVRITGEVVSKPPLPGNVLAHIRTTGLIGSGAQLVLDTNGKPPEGTLAADQEIQTKFIGLAELLPPEFAMLAEDLKKTSQQFRESKIIEHLDQQVLRAGDLMKSVQTVVDDPKLRKDMLDSVANLRSATETANRIGANVEDFSKDLKKLSDNTNGALDDARVTIKKTQDHIDELSAQLNARLAQVATLLTQFQSIAAKVDKGEGTAGAFVNDPKLYQSLVDTSRDLNATIKDLKRLVEQWEEEGISFKLK